MNKIKFSHWWRWKECCWKTNKTHGDDGLIKVDEWVGKECIRKMYVGANRMVCEYEGVTHHHIIL